MGLGVAQANCPRLPSPIVATLRDQVMVDNDGPLDKIKLNASHYLMLKFRNACDGL
jgi:hypothetical protein